ncbi:hypothetical protein GA0115252_152932 [Streptomyces sp. DfronAA-171]|nr:hypothetical protein GA0115252_152932 [Streptomyces sp. DfronAA-171]
MRGLVYVSGAPVVCEPRLTGGAHPVPSMLVSDQNGAGPTR